MKVFFRTLADNSGDEQTLAMVKRNACPNRNAF